MKKILSLSSEIEAIRIKEILEGKHDELPESAFLYVGTIEEAVEKAKKMA